MLCYTTIHNTLFLSLIYIAFFCCCSYGFECHLGIILVFARLSCYLLLLTSACLHTSVYISKHTRPCIFRIYNDYTNLLWSICFLSLLVSMKSCETCVLLSFVLLSTYRRNNSPDLVCGASIKRPWKKCGDRTVEPYSVYLTLHYMNLLKASERVYSPSGMALNISYRSDDPHFRVTLLQLLGHTAAHHLFPHHIVYPLRFCELTAQMLHLRLKLCESCLLRGRRNAVRRRVISG